MGRRAARVRAVWAMLAFGTVVGLLGRQLAGSPSGPAALLVALGAVVLLGVGIAFLLAGRHPDEPWLFRLLVLGLAARLLATYVRYLTNVVGYEGTGDATEYHRFGAKFADAVALGQHVPTLTSRSSTNFIRWITGWLYVAVGPRMVVGYLVFGFVSFWGSYLWYRAAADAVPNLERKRYLLLLLFVPSVVFWPSAIGKEAVLQFSLGLCALGVSRLLYHRWFWGLVAFGSGILLTNAVRPHLSAIVALAFAVAFVLGRLVMPRPPAPNASAASRVVMAGMVIVFSVLAVSSAASFLGLHELNRQTVEAKLQNESEQTAQGGSQFDAPPPSLSPTKLPSGLLTVFFRPLPIEAHGVLQLASAAENTLLLLFVVVQFGSLRAAIRNVRRYPFLLFCLGVVLLYAATFSSFANFGLLARQRTLAMPALLVLLSVQLSPRRVLRPEPERLLAVGAPHRSLVAHGHAASERPHGVTGTATADGTRWRRRPDVLWRGFGGAVVLLPPAGSAPVVLSAPGRAVWELLAEPTDLSSLATALARASHHPRASVREDIERLIEDLARHDLVEGEA